MMCLVMSSKSSELLPETVTEQANKSKQFRSHGARVPGEQNEANVSALEVSRWFVKSGIIGSKPRIDTRIILQEALISWLHPINKKSCNQGLTSISLSYTFHNPRCQWSVIRANPRIAQGNSL